MNTDHPADALDARIDASLQRLPAWDPPADFARRTVAAALRQRERSVFSARTTAVDSTLTVLGNATLIGAAGYAAIVAASTILPWESIAADPTDLVWTCLAVSLGVALWFTRQVLAKP
jgi:hypothetical protein